MAEVRPIDANALKATIIQNHHREFFGSVLWNILDDMPTIDYEPVRHGKWVEQEDFCGDLYYTCSACKIDWVCIDGTPAENGMHYCPNCGANMHGGNTDA